jgi:hypothetical protein
MNIHEREVLEVDQWTSTGNVTKQSWDALKAGGIDAVSGGDSEAIRQIFGGDFKFRTVDVAREGPRIARVWFVRDEDGFPQFFASNYDSSD